MSRKKSKPRPRSVNRKEKIAKPKRPLARQQDFDRLDAAIKVAERHVEHDSDMEEVVWFLKFLAFTWIREKQRQTRGGRPDPFKWSRARVVACLVDDRGVSVEDAILATIPVLGSEADDKDNEKLKKAVRKTYNEFRKGKCPIRFAAGDPRNSQYYKDALARLSSRMRNK